MREQCVPGPFSSPSKKGLGTRLRLGYTMYTCAFVCIKCSIIQEKQSMSDSQVTPDVTNKPPQPQMSSKGEDMAVENLFDLL